MGQDHILWVHGHSAEIEDPALASIERKRNSVRISGSQNSTNWLHFAIPTPIIVDNYRIQPVWLQFRYKTTGGASIYRVDVYDGENKIKSYENTEDRRDGDWYHFSEPLGIENEQNVNYYGIGVSIGLKFDWTNSLIEFEGAGCTFEFSTCIASQRLQIYTEKAPMEFPYRSNLLIDKPNVDIERILISLHGSGGNAEYYLSIGLAAVEAAVTHNVDLAAKDNTLVVAPQFINAGEYYRRISPSILHWRGWRAASGESVEGDLNGDGVPDSGTLSSFVVMDTLLERVCRPSLFPNLKIVVIVGHSNGGRFMSCYAAASRFEQEVATPRGIHIRNVVSGSGSYLYMNDRRYAFVDDTYLNAADPTINWRDKIVDLLDFGIVCEENPVKFNDWPLGLNIPPEDWPYPAKVGAAGIREQFRTRDVHYLIGEEDLLESYEGPERVQGQDTLAKTLLYKWHLEQQTLDFSSHKLHVIPNVGHSGKGNMCSLMGSRAIFGPI